MRRSCRPHQQVRGPGPLEGAWDGRDSTGALVTPGDYCVRFAGRTSTGTLIVSPPVAIKAAAPSDGIEVYALTNPGVPAANPAPGTGITAVVVDTGHQARAAARITIEASPAGPAGSSSQLAARTIAVCERASECHALLPSDIAAADAVAYRVTASEASSLPDARTSSMGWRVTDLRTLPTKAWRVSIPATVDEDGLLRTSPVSATIDIAYYPGSDYITDNTAATGGFVKAVEDNVWALFGVNPGAWASTVATNVVSVGVYAANIPVAVGISSDRGLCTIGGFQRLSFAEVNGVLHSVPCRDNAPGNTFTANAPAVGWHELHHAAYGEADEYCCDGGYYDGVNLYNSAASCTAKASSPGTCAQIIKPDGSGLGWWRGDTLTNDVMVANGPEDLDDVRAGNGVYDKCRSNKC